MKFIHCAVNERDEVYSDVNVGIVAYREVDEAAPVQAFVVKAVEAYTASGSAYKAQ